MVLFYLRKHKINLYICDSTSHKTKILLNPIGIYGIQIWESGQISNINKIQITKNKIFRLITKIPPPLLYLKPYGTHKCKVLKITTKSYTHYRK